MYMFFVDKERVFGQTKSTLDEWAERAVDKLLYLIFVRQPRVDKTNKKGIDYTTSGNKRSCAYYVPLLLRTMVTGHSPGADSERGPELAQKLGRQCMQGCLHRISQFEGDQHWCSIECMYYEKSTMTLTSKELTALSKEATKKQQDEYGDWAKAVFVALPEAIGYEPPEGFVSAGGQAPSTVDEDCEAGEGRRDDQIRGDGADDDDEAMKV